MSILKSILLSITVAFAAGCAATPDLGSWAQGSSELASAVAGEHQQVLRRIDQNIGELQIGETEGWTLGGHTVADWQDRRDQYARDVADINEAMTVMTSYANAISNLAAQGETGKSSVESINTTLEQIDEAVGSSFVPGGIALSLLGEISDLFTRASAQRSLAEAMTLTQETVNRFSENVEEFAIRQDDVVASVRDLERRVIREGAGPNRMAWYVQNRGFERIEETFANELVETAAAMTYLVESLEPRYRERERRRVASTQWLQERQQALDAIATAARTWRQTHADAAAFLRECGGKVRRRCGAFSATNLQLAADRVASVVAAAAPPDASTDAE